MKRIGLFGSTGSIGENVLQVIRNHPDRFTVQCLTANTNAELLIKQALEFKPQSVAIVSDEGYTQLHSGLSGTGIRIYHGHDAIVQMARDENYDLMIGAIVGFAGFLPTIEAIRAGKDIGLANKETLVVGGAIVNGLLSKHQARLIPIDSEHSALFQCLVGEDMRSVRKLILTASGGPFLHTPAEDFSSITVARALKHPNWSMGAKITIDSATLMNKGLEVIEAHWLFGVGADRIDVAIHPQSIIHSMVEFVDGSTKAQLGVPDMKVPIQYAMTYPERMTNNFDVFDFRKWNRLDFYEPDRNKFRCLKLAYDALETGGSMPAVLNAANEIAVAGFLQEKIRFTDIASSIESAMQAHTCVRDPDIASVIETDRWARAYAQKTCL
ncbi:1-deoxy-D-xylulose-5-phosphate reductoisomerase [bacterium]|nr:1-deoxy-D-xylulose-5-phosphate reductoisomerase [bacterium]NUN44473.1 1-deoxy-D-xylulose-5-phosphate reductoisomerase [bacterium]